MLMRHWPNAAPLFAWAVLALVGIWHISPIPLAAALVAAVLAAVHHAEVIAHKVGEPFGTLILALAVTVIEVGLIVSLMSGAGEAAATHARDTVSRWAQWCCWHRSCRARWRRWSPRSAPRGP